MVGGDLLRGKPTGGRIFPGGEDEQILGWWGLPPVGKTLLSFTLNQRKKTLFTILKILKTKPPSKCLLSKHRFKFLLFEYLDNKMYIDVKETM